MSKIWNISKIIVLIYRLGIDNLPTKIVSFPDQDEMLEEIVFSLEVSMNANNKNSQIPCLKKLSMSKICCDKKAQLVQFTDQKKHLENDRELIF